jgi:hypothetical protein
MRPVRKSWVPLRYPVDKLACDIVHGSQVRCQTRRGVEIPEELRHLIR